jgi:hypothetical protein
MTSARGFPECPLLFRKFFPVSLTFAQASPKAS